MEHVDKNKGAEKAHSILSGFMTRCSEDALLPDNDLYSKLDSDRNHDEPNSDTTKNILKRQLLEESCNRCCYCMRSIDESNTTLEHIIPNKILDAKRYEEYRDYFPKNNWNNLVFSKDFLANPRWPYRAFPHTIAYENLIPSCNGKFEKISSADSHARDTRIPKCCNNKRGDEFVIPFVLNKQMVSEFKYLRSGYVIWPVDREIIGEERKKLVEEHKRTIDVLGLNCDELVAIRRIWCFLSSIRKDCTAKIKDSTVLFLTEDDDLTDDELNMLRNFWNDNYWCLLEEYRYFNDKARFQ